MRLTFPIDGNQKLRYLLQVIAMAMAISAIQYIFQPERPYEVPMRYSLCISLCTWFLIDFGRHFFKSAKETGWPMGLGGFGLQLFAIVVGYLVGTLAGDWWCGWPGGSFAPENRAQLRNSILITAMAGTAFTYYFYSINKSAYLESRMSEAKAQANEARLKLLETQLEPHMMFNTLANLRVLISVDPQAAQRMLDHLIAYLRATLGASRNATHSLQAEFDRLRDYLELMAVRMGPRMQYTLDLPAELRDHAIPTLLLQPLVENSIQHGLEPQVEGGSITVRASRDPTLNRLTLSVEDTGVGINHAAPKGPHTPDAGFGLAQVRERLHTVYGAKATLSLGPSTAKATHPGGGACVTLHLPWDATP